MPIQLANYLFFATGCEQALEFYADCGLGRVVELKRQGEHGMPVANAGLVGKVLHARFEGPGVLFFASDNADAEPMRGSAHLLMLDTKARTSELFERLGRGGNVTTALGLQPWGAYYGKLTDRFGVQWMLNCQLASADSG